MSNKCGCSIWDSENGSFFIIVLPIVILFLAALVYGYSKDGELEKSYNVKSTIICKDKGGLLYSGLKDSTLITICIDGYSEITKLN
jgi:hypothetical protein